MAREFSKSFYKSAMWECCRNNYRQEKRYICELCGEPGVIVHHKIPLTPDNINDPSLTVNHENLQLLCVRCHNRVHHQLEGKECIRDRYRFGKNGEIITME